MKYLFLLALLICNLQTLWAQERCGTVAYETQLAKGNPKRETKQQFEDWMKRVQMAPASKLKTQAKNQTQSTFVIPVVVHVVHNGEPVGTGVNISDAQILSQINVLNNDFNRLNADRTNTPTAFQSVAGSFDVQFVLAKQDPTGIATNGIRRVQGTKTTWSLSDNFQLKSQSYWPAEDYLNVWVCNLTGFLGYTQFPVSTLPGLEGSSNERLTDGIVINYREFGSIDDGPFDLDSRYNKGRTLTHEMGHFFGLRHIWGDGNCNATDYVSDTPSQSGSTSGCPSHPRLDCGSPQQPRMFQNYLDYTNDACMNLFTQGQVSRMSVVLQNSPRRASLLLSAGSLPPSTLPNDLGIKNIIAPLVTQCAVSFQPSIQVRNYGTNAITSAQIQLVRNGTPIETLSPSLNLLIAQETIITFSTVSLVAGANATFAFNILQTNGTSDGNAQNNSRTVNASAPTVASSLPLFETFASQSNWGIVNPDGLTTWQTVTTPSGKTAAYLDFYDYAEVGATDLLTSPVIDLTSSSKATLIFERAYAPYPGITGERLRVLATTNCNFTNAVELFSKSDDELATTDFDDNNYTPLNNAQWVTEVVPLDGFLGGSVQVAFEGTNANGNNLYITNVRILNKNWLDLSIVSMASPSPVSCAANPAPQILIKNTGNVPINNFTVSVTVNGKIQVSQITNLPLEINEQKTLSIAPVALASIGPSELLIDLKQPNGLMDNLTDNNSVTRLLVVNNAQDVLPLRERFENVTLSKWTVMSQPQQASWKINSTNYKGSMAYRCFDTGQQGDESWLVSPVLNLKSISQASMFFDVSYAKARKGSESLRLLASTDCGLTFTSVLYNQSGSGLTSQISNTNWVPTSPSDWRKQYINLNDYAGQEQVRFAFVVTNGNGNNLYLDNIDFYTSSSANPIVPDELYSIYGGLDSGVKVTFNLDTRTDVRLAIYNSVGQIVSTFNYSDVLNQTYPIELGERSQGVYIVQVQIGNCLSAKRVFFGN